MKIWLLNINPFHATDLSWYPLKTPENQMFSDVFRGVSKEISGTKWIRETFQRGWLCEEIHPALPE